MMPSPANLGFRLLATPLLWLALASLAHTQTRSHTPASPPPTADPGSSSTAPSSEAAILWGIVSYTRWPMPPATLQVCVLGDSPVARALKKSGALEGARYQAVIRSLPPLHAQVDPTQCHVLYTSKLPVTQLTPVLQSVLNSPVLTIGEEQDFCSLGGMFCLAPSGKRFFANLSAIAQSPLRVNPRVLQLTKQ